MSKFKIVTLSSGGIDSSIMMKMLMEENMDIYPLFINYGQLSYKKEWHSTNKICNYLGLKADKIDISGYSKKIMSGITTKKMDIYEDAFLPNRNLLFLLLASAYAYQKEIYLVSIGLIKNPIFPDQTKIFLESAENCIKESLGVDMKILAPLIDIDKNNIYNLAKKFEFPIEFTYYCHSGNDIPCGKCIACREHLTVDAKLIESG